MIEGIPVGYELVRIGRPLCGEQILSPDGRVVFMSGGALDVNYVVLRKIEKPKTYRPFANGDEYAPHFSRLVIEVNDNNLTYLPTAFDKNKVWLGPGFNGCTWDEAFCVFKFKDSGEPFGVEE
jgi:hypothetical protein